MQENLLMYEATWMKTIFNLLWSDSFESSFQMGFFSPRMRIGSVMLLLQVMLVTKIL